MSESKWQPVVGGRAIYVGEPTVKIATGQACIVRWVQRGSLYGASCEYLAMVLAGDSAASVDVDSLAEHPADRRHRRLMEAARQVAKWRDALDYSEPGSDARNKAEAQLNYAIDALEVALEEYDA